MLLHPRRIGRPVNSSNAPMAWPTAMVPPSTVRQPIARAAFSSSVSTMRNCAAPSPEKLAIRHGQPV
jgi:hypothetical protein